MCVLPTLLEARRRAGRPVPPEEERGQKREPCLPILKLAQRWTLGGSSDAELALARAGDTTDTSRVWYAPVRKPGALAVQWTVRQVMHRTREAARVSAADRILCRLQTSGCQSPSRQSMGF